MDNEERVLPLKENGKRELKNILFLIKTNITKERKKVSEQPKRLAAEQLNGISR